MKAMYIKPQLHTVSLMEERIIATSGFIKPDTGNIDINLDENHDPTDALVKDNSFDFEW